MLCCRKSETPIVFMFLAVIGIMYDSSRSLQQMLSDSIHQTLNESAVQQSFNLRQKMEADINALHNIAFQLEEFSEEDMGAYLDKVVQNTGFSVLGLVDADGIGIDDEGNEVEVSDNTLYQQAIRGDVVVREAVEP